MKENLTFDRKFPSLAREKEISEAVSKSIVLLNKKTNFILPKINTFRKEETNIFQEKKKPKDVQAFEIEKIVKLERLRELERMKFEISRKIDKMGNTISVIKNESFPQIYNPTKSVGDHQFLKFMRISDDEEALRNAKYLTRKLHHERVERDKRRMQDFHLKLKEIAKVKEIKKYHDRVALEYEKEKRLESLSRVNRMRHERSKEDKEVIELNKSFITSIYKGEIKRKEVYTKTLPTNPQKILEMKIKEYEGLKSRFGELDKERSALDISQLC